MLTALKLSVLAARVVVTEKQDFTSHLTGINRQDIFFGTSNSVYDLLSKVPFPRQELEGLDKLKGNYRVEEVHFKAEKREDTNLEKEEMEVVKLTDDEWVDQLATMTSREQREMEKFLGERGDIRIMENPRCSAKRSWRLDVQGVGTLFLPLRSLSLIFLVNSPILAQHFLSLI